MNRRIILLIPMIVKGPVQFHWEDVSDMLEFQYTRHWNLDREQVYVFGDAFRYPWEWVYDDDWDDDWGIPGGWVE